MTKTAAKTVRIQIVPDTRTRFLGTYKVREITAAGAVRAAWIVYGRADAAALAAKLCLQHGATLDRGGR